MGRVKITKKRRVAAELHKIAETNGGMLRPSDVVDFARDKDTALHGCFVWDNRKAAQEYRIWQAREIILQCHVILKEAPNLVTRAWVSLRENRHGEGGYISVATVMSDKELRDKALNEAVDELRRIRRTYAHLQELSKVFDEIDRLGRKKKS